MPFLVLNGWTIPVEDDSVQMDREVIGEDTASFSGRILSDIRDDLPRWKITTAPLLADAAGALVALLLGRGHHWSFDDGSASAAWQWSSKGLGASSIASAERATTSPAPRYGAGRLLVEEVLGAVTWPAQLPAAWTAMAWRRNYAGTAWEHVAETSAQGGTGACYVGGTAVAVDPFFTSAGYTGTPSWFRRETNGDFRLINISDAPASFDDLVILPFVAPLSLIQAVAADSAAFALPELRMTGDLVEPGISSERVIARDIKSKLVQAASGGAWRNNMHQITASLIAQPRT